MFDFVKKTAGAQTILPTASFHTTSVRAAQKSGLISGTTTHSFLPRARLMHPSAGKVAVIGVMTHSRVSQSTVALQFWERK